jgi:hypothetical protein
VSQGQRLVIARWPSWNSRQPIDAKMKTNVEDEARCQGHDGLEKVGVTRRQGRSFKTEKLIGGGESATDWLGKGENET